MVHARRAELDVYKKSIYACVICCEANGQKRREIRGFGTMTADLPSLADWLRRHQTERPSASRICWCRPTSSLVRWPPMRRRSGAFGRAYLAWIG